MLSRIVVWICCLSLFAGCVASNSKRREIEVRLRLPPLNEEISQAPSWIDRFDCFLVNVTGADISDSFTSSDLDSIAPSCLGLGSSSALIDRSVLQSTGATLKIRPGKGRKFQILGIFTKTASGCRNKTTLGDLFSGSAKPSIYVVGAATADIEGQTTVRVKNVYTQATAADLTASCASVPTPPAPTVSGILPVSGTTLGGTRVTIFGANFLNRIHVQVGGVACTDVDVQSSTTLLCTTGANTAGLTGVSVDNPDTQTDSITNAYTYYAPPLITSVDAPAGGPLGGGNTITIRGADFRIGRSVTLGGVACTGASGPSDATTCVAGAHAAGTVDVTITNSDGQFFVLANGYTYRAAPVISSASPAKGSSDGGTLVTINGSGFVTGASITINGSCAIQSLTATKVTCRTTASSPGTHNIIFTNSDTQSDSYSNFTYQNPLQWTANAVFHDGTRLYVSDLTNHRVLIWDPAPTATGLEPDYVLGQPDLFTNSSNNGGRSASSLSNPTAVLVLNGTLFVSDHGNHRVLAWNSAPAANFQAADFVIGQADFTSGSASLSSSRLDSPVGLAGNSSNLYIADRANNRVLAFNPVPNSTQPNATYVIGQSTFSTNVSGCDSNRLFYPSGVWVSSTKLFVSDTQNNRILIFNSLPAASDPDADVFIGQATATSGTANSGGLSASSLHQPHGVLVVGSKMFISDEQNHRVTIWNSIPGSNNTSADVVLGQPDFSSNSQNNGGSNQMIAKPRLMHSDGTKLFIADEYNARIMVWNTIPASNHASVDFTLFGQNPLERFLRFWDSRDL